MKMRSFLAGVAVAVAFTAFTTEVLSQQKKSGGEAQASADPSAEMMAEWMRVASPGEHHKPLDKLVGDWNIEIKTYWGGPEGPASVSKGTARVRWILDGRFLEERVEAEMEMPGRKMTMKGLGLTGYDNFQNMYRSVWIDNMGTSMTVLRGTRNPQTGVFTYYGQMDEPMMKVYGRALKTRTRMINDDKHIFEMIDLHAGDDYKVMEIAYTRN